jgi:hypothetical protein
MKENLSVKFPDAFTPAEHAAFTRRVMEVLPRRTPLWKPWFALAATLLLAVGSLFLVARHELRTIPMASSVHVANPLDILHALPAEDLSVAGLAFPSAERPGSPRVDVPFQILKTDHQIRIAWQELEGYEYIIQKCTLSSNGKHCRTKTVVHGSSYQEKSPEESPLVMYTVEAVKPT